MRNLLYEGQFKKDLRLMQKRGVDLAKIFTLIEDLQQGRLLAPRLRNHKLKGNWKDFWECHITPDWLLIYEITVTELILVRTGTHSDLF